MTLKSTYKVLKKGAPEALPMNTLLTVCFLAFLGMAMFNIIPVHLPFFLKGMRGMTNTQIGLAIGAMTMAAALVSMQLKKIRRVLRQDQIFSLISVLLA